MRAYTCQDWASGQVGVGRQITLGPMGQRVEADPLEARRHWVASSATRAQQQGGRTLAGRQHPEDEDEEVLQVQEGCQVHDGEHVEVNRLAPRGSS